jgi:hypothetical protein
MRALGAEVKAGRMHALRAEGPLWMHALRAGREPLWTHALRAERPGWMHADGVRFTVFGMHAVGVHVVGGTAVLGRTRARAPRGCRSRFR